MIAVTKLKQKEFDEMNLYLKDGYDLKKHNLCEDETLLSVKANFENGYEGIVEVFTGEESVMATAYLYDNEGNDITCIESDEGLDTEYTFETKEGDYILQIELEQ